MTSYTIYIVDDEAVAREGLSLALKKKNYNVRAFESAEKVLKAIKEKKPELQIILLTGHATVDKGVEAMKLGALDFVEKPADLDALSDKIKKAKAEKMLIVEEKSKEKIDTILKRFGF